MVGIAELSSGLSSLKAAFDIAMGLNAAAMNASINDIKIPLQEHIIEAQNALTAASQAEFSSSQRIRELEQEVVRLKDWSAERERYEPVDIWRGAIAYMPKLGMENGEPPHWLCANCFNQGRKSFLQFKGQDKTKTGMNGDEATCGCDACRSSLKVSYRRNPNRSHEERVEKNEASEA